jgi:membrane-associated phospholipid phosphatase
MRAYFNLKDVSYLIGALAIYAFLYLLNNNFQYFDIWHIPRTPYDDLVTFSPYWIYIYLAAYLMPISMFFFLRKIDLHLHYLQLFFILTIITNVVFFLFPSTIDRVPVPVEGVDSITKLAFELLFSADKPFNCFPSTHVSTSVIAALAVRSRPRLYIIFTVVSLLISFSALAIGQHFLYDALGGAFVAFLTMEIHDRTLGQLNPNLLRVR